MEKTIAAISTACTASGIIIVRMTGPEAVSLAEKVFRGKRLSEVKSHTIHHGFIVANGEELDEVLVSVMLAPRTYTGEDTVEINCHGGTLVAKKVLELLLSVGAVPAEPGEFTKRAFLNGRMDLSRAEAVIDVIEAKNNFALKAGIMQLKGSVSEKIKEIRNIILDEISYIEAALDDPEHYDLENYCEKLIPICESIHEQLDKLIRSADYGEVISTGIRTVIAGRPNAGKSSLLNLLAGQDKAIVTDIAGTTRDILEVPVTLGDLSLILMDTAGIRETGDLIERIGVDRARNAIENADLILYLVDAAIGVTEEDRAVLSKLRDKPVILLQNKSDLVAMEDSFESTVRVDEDVDIRSEDNDFRQSIRFSAKTREGLEKLEERISTMFHANEIRENSEIIITNARHKALLCEANQAIEMVKNGAENEMSEDFLTIDLMNAYASLGKIIGEEVGEDVINRVFEKFCMGK